jgi:YVTN family beta-propeller protein
MKRFFTNVFGLVVLGFLISCSDDPTKQSPPKIQQGIFVMNEGLYGMNNTTITYYDLISEKATTDYYAIKNGNALGDTGNDLAIYGSKGYLVMTGSSQIVVFDKISGATIKNIPMKDDQGKGRSPRNIAFYGDYAFVCSFDGTVVKLDTATLSWKGSVDVGRHPDAIHVANNKIYVSNSGSLDFPNYDNTVSVIDPINLTEEKRITVGLNPYTIQSDSKGNVYVIIRGNYSDIEGGLVKINADSDEASVVEGVNAFNFTIVNDVAYLYSFDYATSETLIYTLSTSTDAILKSSFINDGTEIKTPYGIYVDAEGGDVFIADANDYTSTGTVVCFDKNGVKKYAFEAGINPVKILHINN